ncbi:MAG: hypothetical protein ACOC2W_03290 [bacterium]
MVKYYKIRQLTKNNKTGDSYGVTLPNEIVKKFGTCEVTATISGTTIVLESGANFEHKRFLKE